MNLKLKSISQLFSNTRTRTIIIITVVLVAIAGIIGFNKLQNKSQGGPASAQLTNVSSINSVPGGITNSPSADYQRLQEQQNINQAQIAAKTGKSAIPTLVNTNSFTQVIPNINAGGACCNCCTTCDTSAKQNDREINSRLSLVPSKLRAGTLIYDSEGKIIGTVGADGKVRDSSGAVLGTIGPDGLVRDNEGNIIGSAGESVTGAPVYDSRGRLIGTVESDGNVRDKNGKIIGKITPDGIVKDLNGAIIGKAGTPIKDNMFALGPDGGLLGKISADGKVHDGQGKFIGMVDADGNVRDLKGNIIGSAGESVTGAPVYDSRGRLIGTVESDGNVRDKNGKIIGKITPDGIVKDLNGAIIGKVGTAFKDNPFVYDSQGRVIGKVNADEKVRDSKGKIIGTLDANGNVRDLKGNIIGKTGSKFAGLPVYDPNGQILGTVDAEGNVRNALGNKIGKIDKLGTVQDLAGRTIGSINTAETTASPPIPGEPVYDKNGKLMGTVGSDRQVHDENGNILGRIDSLGDLHDASGNIIGQIGSTAPGKPIYDAKGKLIGAVGRDGIMRDSQGQSMGNLDNYGNLRNAEGDIIGSVNPPTSNSQGNGGEGNLPGMSNTLNLPASSNNATLETIQAQQDTQIEAQKKDQAKQQLQASMTAQATDLLKLWGTVPEQQYVVTSVTTSSINSSNGNNGIVNIPVSAPAIKAGEVVYAVLLTALNSDEPGPILAEIVSGKFKGGRVIGALTNQGQKVLLTFQTLNLPKISASLPINAVAIDENTARTALASDTDNHYMLRYGSLFAAAFLQGYAQSYLQAGQPIYSLVNLFNPTVPNLSPRGRFMVALGQVGVTFSGVLSQVFNTPPTVRVFSGTAIGLLFVNDVPALPIS